MVVNYLSTLSWLFCIIGTFQEPRRTTCCWRCSGWQPVPLAVSQNSSSV